MVRIAGINIPIKKRVEIALTYIYGIGVSTSRKICSNLSIDKNIKVCDLSENEVDKIKAYIDANQKVETDLRREKFDDISRLRAIGCFRGVKKHAKKR